MDIFNLTIKEKEQAKQNDLFYLVKLVQENQLY